MRQTLLTLAFVVMVLMTLHLGIARAASDFDYLEPVTGEIKTEIGIHGSDIGEGLAEEPAAGGVTGFIRWYLDPRYENPNIPFGVVAYNYRPSQLTLFGGYTRQPNISPISFGGYSALLQTGYEAAGGGVNLAMFYRNGWFLEFDARLEDRRSLHNSLTAVSLVGRHSNTYRIGAGVGTQNTSADLARVVVPTNSSTINPIATIVVEYNPTPLVRLLARPQIIWPEEGVAYEWHLPVEVAYYHEPGQIEAIFEWLSEKHADSYSARGMHLRIWKHRDNQSLGGELRLRSFEYGGSYRETLFGLTFQANTATRRLPMLFKAGFAFTRFTDEARPQFVSTGVNARLSVSLFLRNDRQ